MPLDRLGTAARGAIFAILIATIAALPRTAFPYTPESPTVVAMVERGVAYLEKHTKVPEGAGINDEAGELWLVALTLIKNGKDESHPLVAAALRRAQLAARPNAVAPQGAIGIYAHALSVIFLCELNPAKHKAEISHLLAGLLRLQLPNGTWTYSSGGPGDTSQIQYGILALWTADHAGFDVPTESIERACNWLLRTQDLGGGFAYHPADPPGGVRVKQDAIASSSMSAAGVGSVYICGDLLGFAGKEKAEVEKPELPPALRAVQDEPARKSGKKRRATKLNPAGLLRAQADGDAWLAKNVVAQNYIVDSAWVNYFLYAFERYESFREVATGRSEPEPAWYNFFVDYLKSKQRSDGSWDGDHSAVANTAFAILVLIRSTKKAIAKVVVTEGALLGGRGLPTDVTNVKLKGNQVVGVTATKSIDDLLDLLEGTNDAALESALEGTGQVALGADATTKAKQAERLRKIVSLPNYQARILAVKTLAAERDLENVPVLIYALGDPDWRVAKEAQDGLRRISRKFDGFGLPERPTYAQRTSAQQSWKQWFLSIRPEAEFIE